MYLREAANCYIFGLPQAAVAVARAALEDALRKNLQGASGTQDVARAKLKELIDKYSPLSLEGRALAHKVRLEANRVLHKEVTTSHDAIVVIEATRTVILQLAHGPAEQAEVHDA